MGKKMVLIVGAGAGVDFGFPMSQGLAKKIARLLQFKVSRVGIEVPSFDPMIRDAIRLAAQKQLGSEETLTKVMVQISKAMPQAASIDNFIQSHAGNEQLEQCGKLAIVKSILDAEKSSDLLPENGRLAFDHPKLQASWLHRFADRLWYNCTADKLPERLACVGLIVFNYDRCVEHYLCKSLRNYYGVESQRAEELIRGLEIYHPYGAVGGLPWEADNASIEFGGEPTGHQLLKLASQIKTFTEGTDPTSSGIVALRRMVVEAEMLVFLGFAYHKQNLELIKPEGDAVSIQGQRSRNPICVGTAYGISDYDRDVFREQVMIMFQTAETILDNRYDCPTLFDKYYSILSFAD